MLQSILGRSSKKNKDKEEERRIQLMRDVSALRKKCTENVDSAYAKCKRGIQRDDPLMNRMALYNASLMKNNESLLRKCDKTLIGMQTGELRRKGAIIDQLNKMEFNTSYHEAKRTAKKSNVSKLRRRAQKMEKYRSIQNYNRDLINDSLKDDLNNMFEEDDDSDDSSDVAEFVESAKEQHLIDAVLAAPNPKSSSIEGGMANDRTSEVHDDI